MALTKNKPYKNSLWHRIGMDAARLLCSPLLLVFRMKRVTPEGTPYKSRIRGGALLAANHISYADIFVVGTAVWYRRIFFLAAEVVMKGKLRSWLLKGVGAIRVDRRTADLNAFQQAVEVLKQDNLLVIFPQGGIDRTRQIQSLKSGATLIALQAGVPIVPMYIVPTKHWCSRRTVVIGQTLDPKDYIQSKIPTNAEIELVTEKLLDEMKRCAAYRP